MDITKLKTILDKNKLPKFREAQIKRAYFKDLANDWSEVSVLSKDIRKKLSEELSWDSFKPVKIMVDKKTKTSKVLLELHDGEMVESVLIRHKDGRNTVCVSSQVGCPLGCAFCATGHLGFKRNLLHDEIAGQVVFFARVLKEENAKVTNVVFMGMGEPLLNYENVISSVKVLNDPDMFGLGARHISISTIGIVPGIKKIADEPLQINLAFSLHAAFEELRDKLVPMNKQYGISEIFDALDLYAKKTNRKVMVEYLMIKGINDSEKDAQALASLLKDRKLFYINLIKYHETKAFKPSSEISISNFMESLKKNRVQVTRRVSFGESIWAACGQLAPLGKPC